MPFNAAALEQEFVASQLKHHPTRQSLQERHRLPNSTDGAVSQGQQLDHGDAALDPSVVELAVAGAGLDLSPSATCGAASCDGPANSSSHV